LARQASYEANRRPEGRFAGLAMEELLRQMFSVRQQLLSELGLLNHRELKWRHIEQIKDIKKTL